MSTYVLASGIMKDLITATDTLSVVSLIVSASLTNLITHLQTLSMAALKGNCTSFPLSLVKMASAVAANVIVVQPISSSLISS